MQMSDNCTERNNIPFRKWFGKNLAQAQIIQTCRVFKKMYLLQLPSTRLLEREMIQDKLASDHSQQQMKH